MIDSSDDEAGSDLPSNLRASLAALSFLVLLTIFRFIYATHLGLAEDEAHYWQWSRHLALSYYDQGPGIAYIIRLGTDLLGNTPLGIRSINIILGAGTGWLAFGTMLRWTHDSRVALTTLALLNITPLIAAGSVLATYDGPQVFFWSAALFALAWTLQSDKSAGWYLVGVLSGLGLLCKLTMLLFAPGVLILLLWVPAYRKYLASPHPYLAFAIMLLLFSPVLEWNRHNGWVGFLHAATLGSRRRGAAPFRWFGDFLAGQAIALGPFVFLIELYALARLAIQPLGQRVSEDAVKFIVAFSAPTLLLCLVVSLKSKMEINWPVPAHVMGLGAVGIWCCQSWDRGNTFKRLSILAAVALSLSMTAVAYFPALLTKFGWPFPASPAQKLNETYGWEAIADAVQTARVDLERSDGKPVFVSGINYRVNSVLAYYLPDKPETKALYLDSRRDEYLMWTRPDDLVGQNAILCLDDKNDDAVRVARTIFVSVSAPQIVTVYRRGFEGAVKRWEIYKCRGFKGYDPNRYLTGY